MNRCLKIGLCKLRLCAVACKEGEEEYHCQTGEVAESAGNYKGVSEGGSGNKAENNKNSQEHNENSAENIENAVFTFGGKKDKYRRDD